MPWELLAKMAISKIRNETTTIYTCRRPPVIRSQVAGRRSQSERPRSQVATTRGHAPPAPAAPCHGYGHPFRPGVAAPADPHSGIVRVVPLILQVRPPRFDHTIHRASAAAFSRGQTTQVQRSWFYVAGRHHRKSIGSPPRHDPHGLQSAKTRQDHRHRRDLARPAV